MQKKRVLVTRSFEENQKLCNKIDAKRFNVISWDLIKYSHSRAQACIINEIMLNTKTTDIIITGKYCASLIPKINHGIRFWVVGNATSQTLQKQGANVCFTAKNVDELIDNLPRTAAGIVYLSGNYITKDIQLNPLRCRQDEFKGEDAERTVVREHIRGTQNSLVNTLVGDAVPLKVKRYIVYNVTYKSILDNTEVSQALEGFDYILIFSLNCARTLIKLLLKYGLLEPLKSTKIISISGKVSNFIRLYFKNTIYCVNENIDQMLEILNNDE